MPLRYASRPSFGALSEPFRRASSKAYTSLPSFPTFQELVAEESGSHPQAVAPPRFPTFLELVEADKLPPPKSDRPKGLFEELLNARPEALYLHVNEHLEQFEEGTLPLLYDLVEGGKRFRDLTLEEQGILDRATFHFATDTPRTQKTAAAPRLPPTREDPPDEGEEKTAEETPTETSDINPEEMRPYWWV